MYNLINKLKYFCLVLTTILSCFIIILILRQSLVVNKNNLSQKIQIEFLNTPLIDQKLAEFQIKTTIQKYLPDETNLMLINLKEIYNTLKNIGWIENIIVTKNFPNTIKIIVQAYNIIACKEDIYPQSNEIKTYPITTKGIKISYNTICNKIKIIDSKNNNFKIKEQMEELILPEIPKLLYQLNLYPNLLKKITSIEITDSLNFNLKLYNEENKLLIKLPEKYIEGINKLIELETLSGILSKNIEIIDMQVLDNILIKLKEN